jgi:Asp-tRNA(Asn)/Glu-tRNA(Gln) amidotransferase A subunit family amidase
VASAWVPLTITDAAQGLRSGHWSSVDLVDASLSAIRAHNPRTNAFITVDEDAARLAAHTADVDRRRGLDRGRLHGIPISVKDLFDIAGQPTTAASRVLAGHVATKDATAVSRLREAGAIFLGKTNLHEFALGSTGDDSAFGPVTHPLDSKRMAGGSSSGSAVAVTLLMGLASLGSDTGGSIRIPAAACGVVGLKPSLGEIPLHGAVPLSMTLDHAGPITRSVGDAATLWAILADRPAVSLIPPATGSLALGAVHGYFAMVTDEVRAAYEAALTALRASGLSIRPVEIRGADRTVETYTNLALPEAAAWHAHYLDTRPGDYTAPVRNRLQAGQQITAVQYLTARQQRLTLTQAVDAALEGCQALVLPTLPIVAPLLGTVEVTFDATQHQTLPVRSAMLRQTQLFNLTGHPAITLPVKTAGLPVGLQLVGRRGATADLLAVAAAIEGVVNP